AADQNRALPTEVPRPFVPAWVEEPGPFPSFRVDPGQVRAFVVVVGETGKGEIGRDRFAAVLLGNDVVELEPRRRVRLRELAVLAAISRPFAYQIGKSGIHTITRPSWADLSGPAGLWNAQYRE